MTARSSGRARRAPRTHAAAPLVHDQTANAGKSFDIADYVKTSRRAQQLPESVDDPAVLERLIALLQAAELEKRAK
jgi:hypothetical protein